MDVIIGVALGVGFLLLIACCAGIGYLIYEKKNKEEQIILLLPGPGKAVSDSKVLIPHSRAGEFYNAMTQENAGKGMTPAGTVAVNANANERGYV